jgi:hypothetical protein
MLVPNSSVLVRWTALDLVDLNVEMVDRAVRKIDQDAI